MGFSIGIIGLPNVGKSTLFKALTKKQVDISNYPFCTINPNVGMVKVPDKRLDTLGEILKPGEIIPTYIEFVDIAGLVKGAHKGEGLGNQFLARIREVDAIAHVVRAFSDPNVTHVAGKVDPRDDIETVKLELIFADLVTVEKRLTRTKKEAKSGLKEAIKLAGLLEKIKDILDKACPASRSDLTEEEKSLTRDLNLLTVKPVIYVMNIDENKIPNSKFQIPNSIPICAKLEAELAALAEEEAKEYLKEYGLEKSGLDTLITAAYKLLDLITFFTCQNQILQAWTIPQGIKAPQAAAKIHADMAKGFIRAEVTNWKNLAEYGSEQVVREKGLIRTEGKEYSVLDGDVIHFKFKV